ncbi:MAG: DUF3800 domain-containing protein [Oscillospiraceae bacterium]|nr:DUF3800 domain-containing protein [Oscillospiraceae bacterium]
MSCTIYIDESGDLGANRGTKWFVLTAVIVDASDEPNIRNKLKAIKSKLNLQAIHFRNVKDFNKRSYIVNELAGEHFQMANILFDTNQYDKNRMQTERIAYNYICRYLLERVSWLLRDTNRRGKIVLSSRGTSKDGELVGYIRDKLLPYPDNQIVDVFSGVECKQASVWDMLQLADVCATSMFYSHEINGYGFITPCFLYRLREKLYRRDGKLIKYGLKYFKDNMKPPKDNLKNHKVCENKKETPSATAT